MFITHCAVDQAIGSHAAGAANRVVNSANEVSSPIKLDHMLAKEAWVCIIPRHERDVFQAISQIRDMLELQFFRDIVSRCSKKINTDFAECTLFLEKATFLEHSRINFVDQMITGRAISPNLYTVTFVTPLYHHSLPKK